MVCYYNEFSIIFSWLLFYFCRIYSPIWQTYFDGCSLSLRCESKSESISFPIYSQVVLQTEIMTNTHYQKTFPLDKLFLIDKPKIQVEKMFLVYIHLNRVLHSALIMDVFMLTKMEHNPVNKPYLNSKCIGCRLMHRVRTLRTMSWERKGSFS